MASSCPHAKIEPQIQDAPFARCGREWTSTFRSCLGSLRIVPCHNPCTKFLRHFNALPSRGPHYLPFLQKHRLGVRTWLSGRSWSVCFLPMRSPERRFLLLCAKIFGRSSYKRSVEIDFTRLVTHTKGERCRTAHCKFPCCKDGLFHLGVSDHHHGPNFREETPRDPSSLTSRLNSLLGEASPLKPRCFRIVNMEINFEGGGRLSLWSLLGTRIAVADVLPCIRIDT